MSESDSRDRRRRADAAAKRKARNARKSAGYRLLTVYVTVANRSAVLRAIRTNGGLVGLAEAANIDECSNRPQPKSRRRSTERVAPLNKPEQSVFLF